MGLEGEGKEGGDERREGMVPAGPRRRLRPRGLLSLPIRRGVWGGGFILVRPTSMWIEVPAAAFFLFLLRFWQQIDTSVPNPYRTTFISYAGVSSSLDN